jgi:hypothetical protein
MAGVVCTYVYSEAMRICMVIDRGYTGFYEEREDRDKLQHRAVQNIGMNHLHQAHRFPGYPRLSPVPRATEGPLELIRSGYRQ